MSKEINNNKQEVDELEILIRDFVEFYEKSATMSNFSKDLFYMRCMKRFLIQYENKNNIINP